MAKVNLKNLSPQEVKSFITSLGASPYRGRQLCRWLFHKCARSFEEMTDIPSGLRNKLEERCQIKCFEVAEQIYSSDGTRKFILRAEDGLSVETVLISDGPRLTLCLSSQIGCKLGCSFCLTGKRGFSRELSAGEIIEQILIATRLTPGRQINNFVFMGMGEPLENYENTVKALRAMMDADGLNISPRRITLSTAGLLAPLRRFVSEGLAVNLAVSLNSAFDEVRSSIMPINKTNRLADLLDLCRSYPLPKRSRITFEYVLLRDVNDSESDARKLCKLLRGLRCKINLIPYNESPGLPYGRPSGEALERFRLVLINGNYTAITRRSKGADIGAACGQLGGRHGRKPSRGNKGDIAA